MDIKKFHKYQLLTTGALKPKILEKLNAIANDDPRLLDLYDVVMSDGNGFNRRDVVYGVGFIVVTLFSAIANFLH
jgi:hypothetical protein